MNFQRKNSHLRKLIYCIVVFQVFSLTQKVAAQQLPLLSQYLFNGFLVNPAFAGLDGLSTITLTAREQWMGLANRPMTHIVSFQTRILPKNFVNKNASSRLRIMKRYTSGRVAVGGYVFNDRNGIIDRTGAQLTYAYHIPMKKNSLSLAMSFSMYQFSINHHKIELETTSDQLIDNTSLNMIIPDVGVGAVFKTQEYFAGLSISNLMQSYAKLGYNSDVQFKTYRQYNLTLGYRYELGQDRTFEPGVLVKTTNQLITQVDITAKLHVNDYWGGITYRTGSAFILLGGITINKLSFGYAFDYNLNAISQYSFGSHEIMAAYKFGNTASRMRWLNK